MSRSRDRLPRAAPITGASSGIGRALAIAAAQRGISAIRSGRNHQLLAEVAREAEAGSRAVLEASLLVRVSSLGARAVPGLVRRVTARMAARNVSWGGNVPAREWLLSRCSRSASE